MAKIIDVSAWQEDIDWEAVVAEGIEGVILKLGENYTLDAMFITHVNNAVAAGLPYGIYYYTHAYDPEMAEDDAVWVDEQIKTYLNGATPPLGIWYDAEDDSMTNGDVTACVSKFVNTLNSIGYTYVGIYSGYNWLSENGLYVIDLNRLADYVPIWVAQYYSENTLAAEYPNKNIKLWQFTDKYPVAGLYLDCSFLCGED